MLLVELFLPLLSRHTDKATNKFYTQGIDSVVGGEPCNPTYLED